VFRDYPVSGIPLLDSFYFRYTHKDHHIQAIGIDPASPLPPPSPQISAVPAGQINLTFMDKNRDDEYFYEVSHATTNFAGIERHKIMDFCRGTICKARLPRPSPQHVFVIIGFGFFFPGGDHHIKRIGLWEDAGELNAHFEDQWADDLYRYELEYAYLPPAAVALVGKTDFRDARGGASATIDLGLRPVGPTVLRGFDVLFGTTGLYVATDNHLREFGIKTPGNKIEVYYSDKNPNSREDRFIWRVEWAALRLRPEVAPATLLSG